MIQGVFFDVGGTLYSYKNMQPAMMGILRELAERLKLRHEFADVARHYQAANRDVDKLFAQKSFYLFRDYFEATFRAFLSRIDREHQHEHFEWFERVQRERLMGALDLQPDCLATLARLKEMGVSLSAVSNADENHLIPLIERGGLHRWLDHWTSSEAAGSCKPDRQFFEIALGKAGLTAGQVLFVGDSREQDIQGAHAVGMKTALITELDQPAPMHVGRETPDPDFTITRLSELPAIVAKLRATPPAAIQQPS
ncbi:MAG TPA: HAD family hydrolase [Steroidobacteraceae bacterium]|nr:HAD family hydrolase [Steroidobacteraceae bacterium]